MDQDKAFAKYDALYCKKHLRHFSDGWWWFLEFQWTDREGVKLRRKLMLKANDMDLLAAQASERIRCVITLGWNAMLTKYYRFNPSLGEHCAKCRKLLDVEPRTFKQYITAARYIMAWLKGGLDDPCKYGQGRNGRARIKLLDECKLSEFTVVGLRRFEKLPNSKAHLPYAKCLFTSKIIKSLYGERLRRPWPFVEFTSYHTVVRPLKDFGEPSC